MTYEPRRPPRHEDLTVRGIKHRLTWWGDPTDAPIVLLHGFLDCGDTWQFLADCLPAAWSLVAPDWRGFGGSEWAPGGYWFPDYLADLEALLDSLTANSRARVIGHSMGANVAALYAGIRPKRLQWLVNLEGIGLPRSHADSAPTRYAEWLDEVKQPPRAGRYASVEQLATVLMQRNPRLPSDRADFIARAWSRPVADDSANLPVAADSANPSVADDSANLPGAAAPTLTTEVRLAFDPRHRFVNPVLYRIEEAEACWSRVEVPMLLLAGTNSAHQERRLKHFNDERVHTLFHDAQIVELPGLGHMMHHEDPQTVANHIIDFERAQS